MYIWLFILMATSLAAQETYVIDSVCVGADRNYRMDGEKGSTYIWHIQDTFGVDIASPGYLDFTEVVAPGDTIWGSEISHLWDTKGEFDIVVEHFSSHGCDTVEQGRVKVYEQPEVILADNDTICALEDIVVSGDTAWNYSTIYWESSGDGTFSDLYSLHPTYFLGANDSLSGSITLKLTAYGLADNETCFPISDSTTIYFSDPEIHFLANSVLCFGDNSASIKAEVTNGIAPYNYSWTGPGGFTASTDSIGELVTGTYILTVTDDNGCSAIDSVYIYQPDEILLSIDSVQNLSCYHSNDGFILASATGGTDTLIFNWQGYSGYTASGNKIYNLPADTFIVTVTDANGCIAIDTAIVTEPEELIAIIDTINSVQCTNFDNGSAHVEVFGGTAPYSYEWSTLPVQDSAWAVDLEPGTYSVIVTDANGCLAYDTVDIIEPSPIVMTADSIDVRCGGNKPGSIDLHVSGGTPFVNDPHYLFEWSDSTGTVFATTEDVENLEGDQLYTVWVTDSLGCEAMHQVYINEIKNVKLEAVVDSALCYGDLWSIDLTVSRGRKPYTYAWTDTAGVVISTDEDMLNIPAGNYWVTVYDKDSCNESMNFILEEPEEILADLYPDDTLICETEITRIQADPDGGTGAYTHLWTGSGAPYLDRTDTTVVYFGVAPSGTYQLIYTVTDENNCSVSDSVEIEVLPE